jgi:hypothetical protein
LAGSPDRAGTLDFSARGLAELASDSNDLLLVLDDTEKAEDGPGVLVRALKSVVHTVPGGRSKIISRGADQTRFPRLRWSTFGLSSSPRPIPTLAKARRWTMSAGDRVRLFDISVPGPKKGGIFDRIDGTPTECAKRSVQLIARLERGYLNHHGHVFPQWLLYLMAKDRSKQIMKLVTEFVEHVGATGQGWEGRFARKFGYIYAAMKLGIAAGLLPWPENLPLQVVTKCHRKARNAAKTDQERAAETAAKLHSLIRQRGRVLDAPRNNERSRPIKVTRRCIAIRYFKDGRLKLGILDRALQKIFGTKKAKAAFTRGLAKTGLLSHGHGHAGTIQERLTIERAGRIIKRPRLWSIDAEKFVRLLKKNRVV